jgi:ArsR family transcriptional regulator
MLQRPKEPCAVNNGPKELWNDRARLLKVMAHPVRLRILEALSEGSQCVKDLNSLIPIVQPHLSQHMAALRRANLVDCHACGPLRCYYLLRPALVKKLIQLLRHDHSPRPRDRRSILREARRGTKVEAGRDL